MELAYSFAQETPHTVTLNGVTQLFAGNDAIAVVFQPVCAQTERDMATVVNTAFPAQPREIFFLAQPKLLLHPAG